MNICLCIETFRLTKCFAKVSGLESKNLLLYGKKEINDAIVMVRIEEALLEQILLNDS